uniref:Protein transport protein sec16 n=1 Tax=Davidia involucrata TaxID=16924 RepID=A0A5B7AAT1_DAVIN
MASNPPFQVEDQTDEDFFNKLVDDDDEFKVTASSAANFADGNDSDEAKAFANLSIGEVGTGFEDSGGEGGVDAKDGAIPGDDNRASVAPHVEESSSLVSSNSFEFDSLIESSNDAIGSEVTSDSTTSKRSGSAGSGVKEVQWTAFNTDSAQNGSNGFGSYSDFFCELGDSAADPPRKAEDNLNDESKTASGNEELKTASNGSTYNYVQYQEDRVYGAAVEQSTDGQDLNSSQYWENLYPGWKYDPNTGQWYQVDGYDATANVQGSFDSNSAGDWAASDGKSEVSYLQQTAQSVVGTVTESGTTESVTNCNQAAQESGTTDSVSNWNQVAQGNNEYPAHMVFDPQYPGWYYDTIAQEWRSMDTYTSSIQSTFQAQDQLNQNGFSSTGISSYDNDHETCGKYGQASNYGSHGLGSQGQDYNWAGSLSNYNQQGLNMWQPETVAKNEVSSDYSGNQQLENHYGSSLSVNNHVNQQKSHDSWGTVPFYEKASQGHNDFTTTAGSQGFVPGGNFSRRFNQPMMEQNEKMHVPNGYYGNHDSVNFSQAAFQSNNQFSYAPNVGKSSAGRPPHALVTFGFGGKLILMKDNSSFSTSSYGSQDPAGGSISVLNLMEVVTEKTDASSLGMNARDYFHTLCRQSFPSPLVGGNVGGKELNKWIDDRITNCEARDMDYRKGEVLRLLLSLLKIAYQHYGKLRSPFGTDIALKEGDVPESAVARLFASAKRNGAQFSEYGALAHCLQKLPSEGQMRATASEVQSLLVAGRKKEALHCAQEGQLWGPALVLAAQLGDQFYVDTVKQMALRQLVAGSPLRTLSLLIAGQPADVFSTDTTAYSGIPGAVNMSQQPAQLGTNGMLDDWEENLAVITANRTKDDELVLVHLGDCLWKERSDIIAAHICYLVAETNFEPYSDSARLCLIGADHWKFPRTYASPEAIQRTELYEYSKLLGNSQFVLLPFQPYKLIYAHMLAEVGRISESLKYCQAVLKSLKTGRAPEVDTWRQVVSSLEERIRTHQQGGYSTNLAPAKLVGKLLNLFDSTAHRVVGGLPPPVPSTSQGSLQGNEHYNQPMGPRVSTSQSTMTMSSLMPSASMEPISEWTADSNRMTMHYRSVSEPDFGRTPRQDQVDLSKEATSSNAQGKASVSGEASRFGRFSFGSQLLQKTVGLVLKPRQDRQAKLGEKNKFYYDEKLKRWVEEGAEQPAEEAALPPPPPTAAFQNGMSDYNLKSALKSEGPPSNGSPEFISPAAVERSSGIPPIPPSSNQFSARGRMGVRSRYVDTFNQGGGNPTNLFQTPSVPSIKPTASNNPKFFVPTPVSSNEQTLDTIKDSMEETAAINENPSISTTIDSFRNPAPSSMPMQRFPSMDNISNKGVMMNGNGSLSSQSRRTASWSGSFSDAFSPPQRAEPKPLGEVLGMPPSSFMPSDTSLMHLPTNGGSFGDDLHEVQL